MTHKQDYAYFCSDRLHCGDFIILCLKPSHLHIHKNMRVYSSFVFDSFVAKNSIILYLHVSCFHDYQPNNGISTTYMYDNGRISDGQKHIKSKNSTIQMHWQPKLTLP